MKIKLITSIIATSLLTLSTAHASLPPKPAKCPGVSALQSVALTMPQKDQDDGTWALGVMRDNYDTQDAWTFVVAKIQADDANDATTKANEAVKSLKFADGPKDAFDMWFCSYTNDKGYVSLAINPAFGLNAAKKLAI